MSSDLSLLICGKPNNAGTGPELGAILGHVQTSIDHVVAEISWLSGQDDRRVSMLGPFFGRSLLELATTALIGRLDPLRVLLVREIQAQPDYDASIPWKSSMRWQGDVLAGKKVLDLWGDALDYEKVTRALLGDYYDHLLWRPAVQRMLNVTSQHGSWLAQLAAIEDDAFIPRKREEISRLYSSLSKGIHHEFLMPPGILYDRNTVVNLVLRTVHLVADLALVSHFVGHCSSALDANEAFELFNRLENVEVIK